MSASVPPAEGAARRTVAQKNGDQAGNPRPPGGSAIARRLGPATPYARYLARARRAVRLPNLFTTSEICVEGSFPKLKGHLTAAGMLWVSWPKAKELGTDLSLPTVIRIGYSHGMVESTCLSVDDTWSALKFTHPRPGKTYNNSHGTLPAR